MDALHPAARRRARRRPARPHARARGNPPRARLPLPRPSAAAPAQSLGVLVVGALDDEQSLLKTVERAGRHLRMGRRAGRRGAHARGARPHRPPVDARARGLPGPPRREDRVPLARDPGRGVRERRQFEDLPAAAETIGLPAVLKTRRGGYDGKGQVVVRDESELEAGFAALRDGRPLILEAMVPFERELSVLAVRGRDGDVSCWPLVENRHEDGILRMSRAPAPNLDPELQRERRGVRARAARGARLRRGARGRALPGRRRAARERDGASGAQLGALDDRGRGHEPVREPPPRDPRLAARLDRRARHQRDGEPDRRSPRPGRGARRPGRAPPPLRQGDPARTQGRPHHRHRRRPDRARRPPRRLRSALTTPPDPPPTLGGQAVT